MGKKGCSHSVKRRVIEKDYNIYQETPYTIGTNTKGNRMINKGVVYIIKLKKRNLIKIGQTISFVNRMSGLNREHQGIEIIFIIQTRFFKALECYLHEVFKKFLVEKNEIFRVPKKYLVRISNLKTFLNKRIVFLETPKKEINELLLESCQKALLIKKQRDVVGHAYKKYLNEKRKEHPNPLKVKIYYRKYIEEREILLWDGSEKL